MKITFKILAIILVLSVNAKAGLISFSECYMADFKSSDGKSEEVYKSYNEWKDKSGKVTAKTYTLNTNSQTITKIYINSEEEINKYFKTYKIILPKIEKTIFKIEDVSGELITARPTKLMNIESDKTDKTLEYKIDLDLAKARVYSYTIKDNSNPEVKRNKPRNMTKKEFLTAVTLNLSQNDLNNPAEISKNLSKWEDIFDEINDNINDDIYVQSENLTTTSYTEQCIKENN